MTVRALVPAPVGLPAEHGTSLAGVTFVVLDLETTGTSPDVDAIAEVGACKVRGGEVLGTFDTLVSPGRAMPRAVTVLTGITESMVVPAPAIEAVLPALLEFIGDAVVVGHNVAFDLGFLAAAAGRLGYRFAPVRVDTLALARRLVRDEVPDHRLSTLARLCRAPHQPSHRALADALATVDLLHWLLERAGSLGVTTLDDLLALPDCVDDPSLAFLRLARAVPHAPGVYLLRDATGSVLHLGRAADLRARVRGLCTTGRRAGPLLRGTARVDHVVTAGPFEAEVLELRLAHVHRPRLDGARPGRGWYVRVASPGRVPTIGVVRTPHPTDRVVLGPFRSPRVATLVREAVEAAVPGLCEGPGRPGPPRPEGPDLLDAVVGGLTVGQPDLVDRLVALVAELSEHGRTAEAAAVRVRAGALAGTLRHRRATDALAGSGALRACGGGEVVHAHGGLLAGLAEPSVATSPSAALLHARERSGLRRWLRLQVAHGRLRLDHVGQPLASPLPAPHRWLP